jgi:hypothetical protein
LRSRAASATVPVVTDQREPDAPAAKTTTKKTATKKSVPKKTAAEKTAVAGGASGAAVVVPTAPIKRDPRRMYLAGLIQKIRSHADFMRQFLEGQDQNPTLGLAAETGIRDVLRAVLPSSFGVTSGFMCQADGSLIEPIVEGEISPQTDVILYDASHACPFYRMNDIEVLAARDALGFVEVKDRDDGEYALRDMGKGKPGALPHIARLVAHAPDAFRAVVLLRSRDRARKSAAKAAHDQCKTQALTSLNVPHLIYCVEGGYVAVYEYTSNKVHFFDYEDEDGTSALADFLRVLTGFFAARGLASSSSALGLSVGERFKRKIIESLQLDDRAPLPSFRDMVSAHDAGVEDGIEPSFERRLAKFVEQRVQDLYCTATTGRDQSEDVCAGVVVVARLKDGADPYAASFFVLTHQGFLTCVDPASKIDSAEGVPRPQVAWIIAHERPELYFQRVCRHLPESRDPFYATSRTGAAIEREET